MVKVVHCYGSNSYANGASVITMDREAINTYLTNEPNTSKQLVDKVFDLVLITIDEVLVTVYRKGTGFRCKFK